MRTTEEKISEIRRREAEIRQKRSQRHTIYLSFISAAAAVLLVMTAVNVLPQIIDHSAHLTMSAKYASVFANEPAIGFVLVVILAFALGVCVTLLGIKAHRHNEMEKRK